MMNIKGFLKKAVVKVLGKDRLHMWSDELNLPTDAKGRAQYVFSFLKKEAISLPADESLKILLQFDNDLYLLLGHESVRYGGGIHSKHRHIRYHNFFTSNIKVGATVLDIGSSSGELISDIAKKANPGKVIGIELDPGKVAVGQQRYKNIKNLSFIIGDATTYDFKRSFDVITMSNVLEHIEDRKKLLTNLVANCKPRYIIIRVPLFERDWRVPLKKELGLDYRLDDTHCIEYTQETFAAEMKAAKLKIDHLEVRWGEIWAIVSPLNN